MEIKNILKEHFEATNKNMLRTYQEHNKPLQPKILGVLGAIILILLFTALLLITM